MSYNQRIVLNKLGNSGSSLKVLNEDLVASACSKVGFNTTHNLAVQLITR